MSAISRAAASNVTPLRARGGGGGGQQGITRAQRAAVIIAMMGEQAAKPIVDKLDDASMAQVAAALETIQFLPREDLTSIVMDFLQQLRQRSGAFQGGPSKARQIIAGLLDDNRMQILFGDGPVDAPVAASSNRDSTWARLESQKPERIAEYLGRLTPNLIALILRKLDVSVSSEVLTCLDDSKLDPMIGFLVEADHTDPQIESVIARMIDIEFLNNQDEAAADEEDNGHLESVGELLSLIPSATRERLMATLKSSHAGKMESIEKVIFTIDGLPDMLPRNGVSVVFRELGEDRMVKLLASLKGANTAVSDYLLGNISSRLADNYRDQLSDAKAQSPEEAETTQREFLTSLMSLKRRGLITMEKVAPAEA